MLTDLFRSGDSQAVRIPKELAFPADWSEVVVERHGDALMVRPVRRRVLVDIAQKFSAFPAGFMSEGAKDPALLAACVAEDRVLVRLDLDFSDITAYPAASHRGIRVLRPAAQSFAAVRHLVLARRYGASCAT